jgi:hypothetical protein
MSEAAMAVPTATETIIRVIAFFWLRKDFLSKRNNMKKQDSRIQGFKGPSVESLKT